SKNAGVPRHVSLPPLADEVPATTTISPTGAKRRGEYRRPPGRWGGGLVPTNGTRSPSSWGPLPPTSSRLFGGCRDLPPASGRTVGNAGGACLDDQLDQGGFVASGKAG